LANEMVEGAIETGFARSAFALDSDEAGELLANEVGRGDVILVKGSRAVRTEKVIEKLKDRFELEDSKKAAR